MLLNVCVVRDLELGTLSPTSEMLLRSSKRTALDCKAGQRSRYHLYTVQRGKQVTYQFSFSSVKWELRGEMVQGLRVLAAIDQSLAPRTHIRKVMTACNFSPRGSDIFFHLLGCPTQVQRHTNTHK